MIGDSSLLEVGQTKLYRLSDIWIEVYVCSDSQDSIAAVVYPVALIGKLVQIKDDSTPTDGTCYRFTREIDTLQAKCRSDIFCYRIVLDGDYQSIQNDIQLGVGVQRGIGCLYSIYLEYSERVISFGQYFVSIIRVS